jgi:outer membrane lipoprotein-sorting protein
MIPLCLSGQFLSGSQQLRLTPFESGCYIEPFKDTGEFTLRNPHFIWIVSLTAVAWFGCGCAVSKKTVVNPSQAPGPLQTASKSDLIVRYNTQATAVTSLNATVSMKLTAGSAYSGVIEQYHEVNGFILASRPASIRVIGQAPVVGKNIFDMVSDGETFHIFIPSKNKFLEGKADLERPAKKPIENLRPQHLVDALLWKPTGTETPVLFEEDNEPTARYYVLTVILLPKKMTRATTTGVDVDWEITQKIWFDRSDLNVARIEIFAADGKVNSDVRYGVWEAAGAINYPRQVAISRPGDDYNLEITIKKIALKETITPDRFVLQQPAGSDLVHVGEDTKEQP